MALNIPPAVGVKPHEASQRLRVLIKALLSNPSHVTGVGFSDSPMTYDAHAAKQAHVAATDKALTDLSVFLDRLIETAKLRKPSLIKQEIASAKASGVVYLVYRKLRDERSYHDHYRHQTVRRANELLAAGGGPSGITKAKLEEIYKLIQVIPTIPSPTDDSKDARTLRAITAIVKAHFGQIEGTLAQVGQPELPIILMQTVEKLVEHPAPAVVDTPPTKVLFTIGGSSPWSDQSVTGASQPYHQYAIQKGTAEFWNGGDCLLEEAILALWHGRARTDRSMLRLRRNGIIVAYISRSQPIHIEWAEGLPKFAIKNVGTSPLATSVVTAPVIGTAYSDEPGDPSGWNDGFCLLPQAIATLKHTRHRYTDDKFTLWRDDVLYAEAKRDEPIHVLAGAHLLNYPALDPSLVTEVPAATQYVNVGNTASVGINLNTESTF